MNAKDTAITEAAKRAVERRKELEDKMERAYQEYLDIKRELDTQRFLEELFTGSGKLRRGI